VTLSLKGENSPTRGRKLRSSGTKAAKSVSNGPNSLIELKKQLEQRTREPRRGAGAAGGDVGDSSRNQRFADRRAAGIRDDSAKRGFTLRQPVCERLAFRW